MHLSDSGYGAQLGLVLDGLAPNSALAVGIPPVAVVERLSQGCIVF